MLDHKRNWMGIKVSSRIGAYPNSPPRLPS